jgi:phosphoglycolate phosphatase-like HAD superfamily hydrolase
MYAILWDFDGTLAYRDGMWSATLLSLLNKAGINYFCGIYSSANIGYNKLRVPKQF